MFAKSLHSYSCLQLLSSFSGELDLVMTARVMDVPNTHVKRPETFTGSHWLSLKVCTHTHLGLACRLALRLLRTAAPWLSQTGAFGPGRDASLPECKAEKSPVSCVAQRASTSQVITWGSKQFACRQSNILPHVLKIVCSLQLEQGMEGVVICDAWHLAHTFAETVFQRFQNCACVRAKFVPLNYRIKGPLMYDGCCTESPQL